MKKFLSMVAYLFLALCLYCEELRDYICIVRPNYPKTIINVFKETADKLNDLGYSELGKFVGLHTEKDSVFGSGFVCIIGGKSYVLTNYHVCAYADTVSLEFQNADNVATKKLETCKIIAFDDEYDLALIELPASANIAGGLKFYQKAIRDGMDVWSAGYPGLGEKPLWQLGKGSLTNQKVTMDDSASAKTIFFIQHSAPTDAGNSGGPLLVAVTGDNGYEVLGVNTAKAVQRETTNFAVPYSSINTFFGQAFISVDDAKKRELFSQAENQFLVQAKYETKKLNENEAKKQNLKKLNSLALLISTENATRNGIDCIRDVILKAPTHVHDAFIAELVYSSPIDALKFALSYKLEQNLNDYKTFSGTDKQRKEKDGKMFVIYQNNDGDKIYTAWNFENKKWKLGDSSVNTELKTDDEKRKEQKEKSSKQSSSSKSSVSSVMVIKPYSLIVFGGFNGLKTPYGLLKGMIVGAGYNIKYFDIGGMLYLHKQINADATSQRFGRSESSKSHLAFGFAFFGELNVALSLTDNFSLIPYTRVGFGGGIRPIINNEYDLIQAKFAFQIPISAGAKFSFKISSAGKLIAFVDYSGRLINGSKEAGIEKMFFHGFSVGIGYGY